MSAASAAAPLLLLVVVSIAGLAAAGSAPDAAACACGMIGVGLLAAAGAPGGCTAACEPGGLATAACQEALVAPAGAYVMRTLRPLCRAPAAANPATADTMPPSAIRNGSVLPAAADTVAATASSGMSSSAAAVLQRVIAAARLSFSRKRYAYSITCNHSTGMLYCSCCTAEHQRLGGDNATAAPWPSSMPLLYPEAHAHRSGRATGSAQRQAASAGCSLH